MDQRFFFFFLPPQEELAACCWSEGDDFQANRHGMRSNGRDHFALVVVEAVELVEVEKKINQLGEGQGRLKENRKKREELR